MQTVTEKPQCATEFNFVWPTLIDNDVFMHT